MLLQQAHVLFTRLYEWNILSCLSTSLLDSFCDVTLVFKLESCNGRRKKKKKNQSKWPNSEETADLPEEKRKR